MSLSLFWTWNTIFLTFMVLGFAPRLLPELMWGVLAGNNPTAYLVIGVALSLVPLAAVILGAAFLRSEPRRLFALGYVVEGPLMLLLAIRFFVIRQPSPGLTVLMVLAGLGMFAFLWWLLDRRTPSRLPAWLDLVRFAGLTFMLMVGLYAAVWIAFYAVPIFAAFLEWLSTTLLRPLAFLREIGELLRRMWEDGWVWIPFFVLGFLLLIFTSTLFVLTPLAVPYLSARAWWAAFRSLARRLGWAAPGAAAVLSALVVGLAFTLGNRQPQQAAFGLLKDAPASREAAAVLSTHDEVIRAGLVNAYLAPLRYISAVGEVGHVREMYEYTVHLPRESAEAVEKLYGEVAGPLLYRPVEPVEGSWSGTSFTREPLQAASLYQRYYDVPITEGERSTIVAAARQSWSPDIARESWQEVDDREVLLEAQAITVQEHGDWAEIEIMELYRNRTYVNQEVIYYFNLPETAVLTGLWLGNMSDKSRADVFQVAPRGAAQQVYREETAQKRDPALLEQIGPRQYRLRVFPIPPMVAQWDPGTSRRTVYEATPMYLWMSYRTLPQGGAWPLPQLAFHRNVYWDESTRREVNGQEASQAADLWMPPGLPAAQLQPPLARRADFEGGLSVVAVPLDLDGVSVPPALPSGARLAVVIDRSRSMEAHRQSVEAALEQLRDLAGGGAQVDVFLTSSYYRGEPPSVIPLDEVGAEELFFFGGQNPSELLLQFEELVQGVSGSYDGILVLTDGSAYELGTRRQEPGIPPAPLWLVHLSADIPLGYDDSTLEAIQASGGGVAAGLDEALARLSAAWAGQDVVDGYRWMVVPTSEAGEQAPQAVQEDPGGGGFAALLARRLVVAEIHEARGTITDPSTLDRLHDLAFQTGMVTPYSSMIVLVNDLQRRRLESLSQADDRFQREWEALQNTTPSGTSPLTGVPEPEEWLLILSALALLAWMAKKKGLIPQKSLAS